MKAEVLQGNNLDCMEREESVDHTKMEGPVLVETLEPEQTRKSNSSS
jgi:hypothetical protein